MEKRLTGKVEPAPTDLCNFVTWSDAIFLTLGDCEPRVCGKAAGRNSLGDLHFLPFFFVFIAFEKLYLRSLSTIRQRIIS